MEPYHKQLENINEVANPVNAIEGPLSERLRDKNYEELLQETLAALRAQGWLYQSLHWQARGSDFYQLHLLFERLYGGLGQQIDTLAEKMVGYFGHKTVDMIDSINRAERWLREWSEGNAIERAIYAEKSFQALLRHTYDTLKRNDELTLGMDDFLMNVANEHETHLYLLGQTKNNRQ